MRRGKAELAAVAAAGLLLIGMPAAAQEGDASSEWQDIFGEPKPVANVPAALRSVVAARSPDLLVVTGLDGQPIPVAMEWYTPSEFEQFRGGRFLGMSLQGYEDYGYLLVDRAAGGRDAIIETGHKPVFSPDGRFFAAAELSEAGWSNLEGVALWEIRDDATVRRFFGDAFPFLANWRVDRWAGAECVSVSAVPFDWQPPEGEDWDIALPKAPRQYFSLQVEGAGVALRNAFDQPGCAELPTAE